MTESLADLRIGQTLQSVDLTHPFVGRVVGLDFVGANGKPCVLLKSADGACLRVTNPELKHWLVLGGQK